MSSASRDSQNDDGVARLSKELARLDAYSFWTVPAGALSTAGDVIVVGTTGVFLLAAWPAPGAFSVSRGRPVVDGRPIPGIRALRGDAKRLGAKLANASVVGSVTPVVVLTHGVVGMPRDVRGVRVLALAHLVEDLAGRPRILELTRVQRAARAFGVEIPGDRRRRLA